MRGYVKGERSVASRQRDGKSYRTGVRRRAVAVITTVRFRHDECLLASPLNGSSISGDVTNNIDLPVNGIISQSARCRRCRRGHAACLLRGAGAFARRRNKCLRRERKATLLRNPSIYPCPSLSSPPHPLAFSCTPAASREICMG